MQKYQNLLWQIEIECEKWALKKREILDLEKNVLQSRIYENSESKYLTGFWIEEEVGNNSFMFKKGAKLFVPPLKYSVEKNSNSFLKLGKEIVFRDKDEKGDLIESVGLENFILTQGKKTGLPIYVVDNHNWVFYCWAEFLKFVENNDSCPEPFLMVHIDAHKDEGEVFLNKKFEQSDLALSKEQTVELKVSNYINAAVQTGLIQEQFLSFTESSDLINYEAKFELLKRDSQNIILNVDIDIFDPEVSLISLEEKVRLIGYFITKADLITFATSPGFIDQNLAIEIVKIFLKYI